MAFGHGDESEIVQFSDAHDHLSNVANMLMSHYNAHAGVYVIGIYADRLAYTLKGYISAYGVTALGKFMHFVRVSQSWVTPQIIGEINLILRSSGLKPADPARGTEYIQLLNNLETADDWGKAFGVAAQRVMFPKVAPSEFHIIFRLLSGWKRNPELKPFLIELGFSNQEIRKIEKSALILEG